MAMIKFVDDNDRTIAADAKEFFGIGELEGKVLVIRGQAVRDEAGNLTIHASGLYPRPQ